MNIYSLRHSVSFFAVRLFISTLLVLKVSEAGGQIPAAKQTVVEKYVVSYGDVTKMKFINDEALYREGWNTLPQPKFWQKIMLLSPDSALISVSGNRQVLEKINLKQWNSFSDSEKNNYKDCLREKFQLTDSANILITGGKKNFYDYKRALPFINRSINVFKQNNVDPWYAQAILLIESPGKVNTKSGVGANGPFQLMKTVAIKQGLKVNKQIDERTDVERAAYAASRLLSKICIPYTKAMLDSAKVPYNETDLWFRLLVLHSYHAGAGNVAGVIRKINPCEGGMPLIQNVWQTTYRGFKNASQNYSQLALAAFCNFDNLITQQKDSVFLIDGDRMFNAYTKCKCSPYDDCNYLSNCISSYENDLLEGQIPFDYFYSKVKSVENELSGLTPFQYPNSTEYFNDIGFKLLKTRNTEAAFKVFKLNELNYPDYWGTYHGLAETYRLLGENKQALFYYRKSLTLKPNHEESLRGIARLNNK